LNNPHPLAKYRAIATLQNIPEFKKHSGARRATQWFVLREQCKLW
jgi:hypothetical protein